jgi:hypothetical protein
MSDTRVVASHATPTLWHTPDLAQDVAHLSHEINPTGSPTRVWKGSLADELVEENTTLDVMNLSFVITKSEVMYRRKCKFPMFMKSLLLILA